MTEPAPNTKSSTSRWITGALALVAMLVLLAQLVQAVRQLWMDVPYDFEVYWSVSRMLAAGETDLYGWQEGRNNWVYLYPPFFAAIFVPFGQLDLSFACGLWMLLQIPLLVLCLLGLFKLVGADTFERRALVAACALAPLFMAYHRNMGWGQVNLLTLVLSIWGLHAVLRRRAALGGAAIAIGVHTKLVPLGLLPIMLAQRRLRVLAATCVIGVCLVLAPAFYLVPRLGAVDGVGKAITMNIEYATVLVAPRTVTRDASGMGPDNHNNLAPSATLERFSRHASATLAPRLVRWIGGLFGLATYAVALVLAWRRREELTTVGVSGLALVATVFTQVTVWHYHLVMMAIPLAALAMMHERRQTPRWVLPLACGVLAACFNLTLSDRLALLTQLREWGVTLAALMAVWVLMAWSCWRARPDDTPDAVSPDARVKA